MQAVANGERVTDDRLLELARSWPSRRAVLSVGLDTPYKCVGGPIFALQRAGFKIEMDIPEG